MQLPAHTSQTTRDAVEILGIWVPNIKECSLGSTNLKGG
jgi:hypothetical protein